MSRAAIFVDAGYLFAQGSTALTGSSKPRSDLVLDACTAIDQFKGFARSKAPDSNLLRVYWYDGAIGGAGPTAGQALIANQDDVKLRLGFVNSSGQQKGVDSLIVTDLIELARLKSISDAVLLSGDEDVRIGVQIAQNHGVRVHLLGIAPSRGSQSRHLLQEADTTSEWDAEKVQTFLSLRILQVIETAAPEDNEEIKKIEAAIESFVSGLMKIDLETTLAYWKTQPGIPPEFDRKMLPVCRSALGRILDSREKEYMRRHFTILVKRRASSS